VLAFLLLQAVAAAESSTTTANICFIIVFRAP
jgi:hypothetical protein